MTITEHCVHCIPLSLSLSYSFSLSSFLSVDDVMSVLSQTSSEVEREEEEREGSFLF